MDVLDPHALAFDKDGGIGFLKDFVLRKVMPDVFFIIGNQFSRIKRLSHGSLQKGEKISKKTRLIFRLRPVRRREH